MAKSAKVSPKKTAEETVTAKKVVPAVTENAPEKPKQRNEIASWSSIHIYGYGETQLLGRNTNIKVQNEKVKSIASFVEHLVTMQQKGANISMENIHVINISNNSFIDFRPRNEKNIHQRFEWSDKISTHLIELIKEIETLSM
jgi:hypothetical protein